MAKPFATAEGKRVEITRDQAIQIRNMYKDIEKEFKDRIRVLSNKSNISSTMRTQYLKDFSKDLSKEIELLNSQLETTITKNMMEVARAVANDNVKLLKDMGFAGMFNTATYNIPNNAVQRVISGKLYEGKWTLSKAIWSDNQKKLNDINEVVAKGLAANKSAYAIAKDLERYVNPNARKDWNWSKVYPGTNKKIDYNAQRLARTMVSHAYQESFVESTKDNPFIDSYRWLASGGDRMCEICAERDDKIFPKDELPLDHPNGMCTFEPVITKSYDQIASDLRAWVDNEGDSDLNNQLDHFADSLGYNVKSWTAMNVENMTPIRNEVINQNIKIENAKDLTEKWGIPISGIKEECVKNFDDALSFMQKEFGIDPKDYIDKIDNKNPDYLRGYKAYYSPYDKGLHIHKKYSGGKQMALSPEDCAHEITHALNAYLSILETPKHSTYRQEDIANEIITKVYTNNGYEINKRTGLPFKDDIAKTVTKYGSTNSLECLAESTLCVYRKEVLNMKVNKPIAEEIFKEVKERLNDDIRQKNF